MILIDITILLFILLMSAIFINRTNIFSPWSLSLIIWFIEIISYVILDHGLYLTTGNLELAIFLWLISFCFSSILIYTKTNRNKHCIRINYNKYSYNTMFIIAIICVPLSAYLTYKYVMTYGITDNIFFNIRYKTSQAEEESSILQYTTFIALIPLLAECNSPKINKKNLIILYILNIILAITSMAKISLFFITISSLFILVYNKRMKIHSFFYVFIFFIILTIIVSGLKKYSGNISEVDGKNILIVYLLSPLVAFDQMAISTSPDYSGIHTFRFFFQILNSLGLTSVQSDSIQEFVSVPYMTNVYTALCQYYKDFGFIGIIIMGSINGLIYGWTYAKINAQPYYKLFYAYLVATLLLQFFDELFWVRLSMVIQIFILSYIIYWNRYSNYV